MKKLLPLLALLLPALAQAQTARYFQWCQTGAQPITTVGTNSTTVAQASMPSCTVSVYLHGTSTLATIYADSINTPLTNPFTANTDATYGFYAVAATHYDIVTQGVIQTINGPQTETVNINDVALGGGGGGGGSVSIGASGPLTATPNPITNTGVIGMSASGVAAGTYTNPTFTVNSFGLITSASSGVIVTNEQVTFLNALSATITSSFANSNVVWDCYDQNGIELLPSYVDIAAFPTITFNFVTLQSGSCSLSGNGGSGGGSSGGFGIDANTFVGADPCLKIQAAIYSTPATTAGGGIINATNIPVFSGTPWTCSVNPFSTPSQPSPIDFAGLPTSGIVYMPNVALAGDLPFIVPNKWRVQGIGGYGPAPSRTTFQPSNNFLANRLQMSATGGSTGCSSSGGATVTITGTVLPSAANLVGMLVLCSSNASATAVPTPQNAQIVGMITAAASGVLTLSGAGSSGTFSNTGWTIVPLIAGWGPTQSFGAGLDEVAVSCQAPSLTYVTGCVGWLNVSGNESSTLTNMTVLGADYMGMAFFSAQSQNGGEFRNITINSSAHGTNSTIAVELGGTGFNAGGGGGSGLCATGNPCVGTPNRGFFGFTIVGSGTGVGDGGIGFDVNSQNIYIAHSHCESLATCALVGGSAVARNVELDDVSGCTQSGCAITSVVDISAAYASGPVPAPTQAITLKHILPGYTTTWSVRDFVNLVGSTDPVMAHYELGDAGNGSVPPMVFTSATLLSNITSGGVLSNVGSASAAGTVIPIISQLGGVYYAHGFNNNGTTDLCAQFNNALKWIYTVRGITSSVIIDGTGFNRPSPYACATNPFAGAGSTIPASGVLRLGLSALSFSVPWIVPAGWIVQGYGGTGLGAGGATGSLLVPNVNGNTTNANFANDTVTGTVSATAGSVTITGVGSNFTSGNLTHLFLACATLPCTTQTAMVEGVVSAIGSTTSLTLDVPAQANLSGAAYTITPALINNSGIIRDVGIDGYSFGTGGTNGNGGFLGIYQGAVSNSYIDTVSFAHVNALPIDVGGANVGELNRINITSSGLAVSTFGCIFASAGVNIRNLNCATGTTAPTLSYGVYASGQSFTITNALFQDVNIGVELAVSNTVPTNGVTLTNIASGGGVTATTTLVDLGGVNLGTNTLRFAVTLQGLTCGGCTTTINDHLNSMVLTDAALQHYVVGQSASGCRNVFNDSQTANIPNVIACNQIQLGKTTVGLLPTITQSMIFVTDSTTVTAEGQTCVGGSGNKALAVYNGTLWKCF